MTGGVPIKRSLLLLTSLYAEKRTRSGAAEISLARDLSATMPLVSGCESSQVVLHAQRHEHRVETEK
jgi:hypothetical protein